MRTIKVLLLSLLSALIFVACSNDNKDPQSMVVRTKEVWLNLEMGADAESLRLLQNVTATGSIATPFIGGAKEFKILLCVTRSGATAPVYQELTLTVPADQVKSTTDQTDTYYSTIRPKYTGKITVPSDGSGNYSLSAVILDYDVETGGAVTFKSGYKSVNLDGNVVSNIQVTSDHLVGGSTATQTASTDPILVQFPSNGTAQTQIDFKVPYVAEAVSVAPTAKGDALEKVALSFKPSGRLLRFKVGNALSCAVKLTKLRIKTNAFFPDWKYDLSSLTSGNLVQGYRADVNTWERTYTIDLALSGNATAGDYLGLWVMPNSATSGLSTQVYLTDANGTEMLAFESSNALGSKGTQNVNLLYTAGGSNGFPNNKLPYEYFAGLAKDEATVSGTATNIDDLRTQKASYSKDDFAYMTFAASSAAIANNMIYKIPTLEELSGIFLGSTDGIAIQWNSTDRVDVTIPKTSIQNITVGGKTKTYTNTYQGDNVNTIYAVRFQDECNLSRMIYRYRRIGTYGQNGYQLEVSMKYIGPDDTYGTIDNLVQAGDTAFTDAYTLYFPYTGYYSTSTSTSPTGFTTVMTIRTATVARINSSALNNLPTPVPVSSRQTSPIVIPLFYK